MKFPTLLNWQELKPPLQSSKKDDGSTKVLDYLLEMVRKSFVEKFVEPSDLPAKAGWTYEVDKDIKMKAYFLHMYHSQEEVGADFQVAYEAVPELPLDVAHAVLEGWLKKAVATVYKQEYGLD
jgi:hypothetical protein